MLKQTCVSILYTTGGTIVDNHMKETSLNMRTVDEVDVYIFHRHHCMITNLYYRIQNPHHIQCGASKLVKR